MINARVDSIQRQTTVCYCVLLIGVDTGSTVAANDLAAIRKSRKSGSDHL